MRIGSGENGEITFLDAIALVSFYIGLQNLEINITQEDMQEAENRLYGAIRGGIKDIHAHLEMQDAKIDKILEKIEKIRG